MGYPHLAAFQSSESSFSIYRSFDYLHSRVILDLQDELRVLEEGLSELDEADSSAEDSRRKLRVASRTADLRQEKSQRAELLSTIHDKLVRYDENLLKTRKLNAFQRPSTRDYRSFRHWLFAKDPVVECEGEFAMRREDLVSLRQGREWSAFDGWIESSLRKLPQGLARVSLQEPGYSGMLTYNEAEAFYHP